MDELFDDENYELSDPEDCQEYDSDSPYEVDEDQDEPDEEDLPYQCLSPETISATMKKCIEEVNSVLEIPSSHARLLLSHFKWDKERLLERYYSGDQERLFKEVHVLDPHQNSSTKKKTPSSSSSFPSKPTCEICLVDFSKDCLTGLQCNHLFCKYCWETYFRTKIFSNNTGGTISCPATRCDVVAHEKYILSIVKDAATRSRYHKLMADGFVQSHRLIRWCPAPDCSSAIKAVRNDAQPVKCDCGFVFCFGCSQPSHQPVQCDWLKKWLKKCDDDSETSNWISANTKECPKCQVTIEKNGGCNHMVCRNSNCNGEFCWVCLGPWESHGSSYYNCGRYDDKDGQTARDAQAKSRQALERYLFYYTRYMNHIESAKLEQNLYDQVKEKMEIMQRIGMSWIEVQFLKSALDVLSVCRNTLRYTYVFAFYLAKNNQSIIFEDNQKDLEMATEHLSGYLERDMDGLSDDLKTSQEMKQKVQDKYKYCERRRDVLMSHVFQGYENDYWEYKDQI